MSNLKECKKHGLVEHNEKTNKCCKCNTEAVQKRRDKLKILAIDYLGGKCNKCGYDKCVDALDFHHLNPDEKEFGISEKGYTRSWESVKIELNKCILVCSNCHREIHALNSNKLYNKEDLILEKANKEIKTNKEIKIKENSLIKYDFSTINKQEFKNLIRNESFAEIGRSFNVSARTISRWCGKFNFPITKKEINSISDEDWELI